MRQKLCIPPKLHDHDTHPFTQRNGNLDPNCKIFLVRNSLQHTLVHQRSVIAKTQTGLSSLKAEICSHVHFVESCVALVWALHFSCHDDIHGQPSCQSSMQYGANGLGNRCWVLTVTPGSRNLGRGKSSGNAACSGCADCSLFC